MTTLERLKILKQAVDLIDTACDGDVIWHTLDLQYMKDEYSDYAYTVCVWYADNKWCVDSIHTEWIQEFEDVERAVEFIDKELSK